MNGIEVQTPHLASRTSATRVTSVL